MSLSTKITEMLTAFNNMLGVVDGKLRSKANSADVYTKTYLDDPLKTLGANANTASKLKVAREIALGGDATGAVSFDGSGNVTLTVSVPALSDKADIVDTLTPAQIDARIQAVIASAPAALDTLAELSAALGDDPDFAATITSQIGLKANAADVYTITQSDGKFLLKTGTAPNALALGGNAASHFATATALSSLESEINGAFSQLTTAFNDGATQINSVGA